MKTKEVKIGDRTFTVKEISIDDSLSLGDVTDTREITKKLFEIAVDPPVTEELRKVIPMKEGIALINAINELNGLTENFLSTSKVQNTESGE